MTELERARDEFVVNYGSVTDKDGRLCLWSILFALKEGFEKGAEWQAKPEHMKLTEEVRGLIEAAKMTVSAYRMCSVVDDKDAMVLDAAGMMSEEALKPFEKGGK